jgi:hypothetical protein
MDVMPGQVILYALFVGFHNQVNPLTKYGCFAPRKRRRRRRSALAI